MSLQRAEITRTYIKPPPNKTALDVPSDYEYNIFPSSTSSQLHHNRTNATATKQSKQNPIAKFLLRISSSKSNEHNSNYNSLTSNSLPVTNAGGVSQQQHQLRGGGNNTQHATTSLSMVPQSLSNNLPTYSESQLMQQQLMHSSSSWSSQCNETINDGPKTSSAIVCSAVTGSASPNSNIYKSRSMCGSIQACSLSSLSTLPTSMINNIVNNAATIGCSSSTSSIASSGIIEPSSTVTSSDAECSGGVGDGDDIDSAGNMRQSTSAGP